MKKILYTLVIGLEIFMLGVGPAAAATFSTVQVRATVGAPTDTVMISVSPTDVNFASITASLSQYRFRKPLETETQVMVDWDAIVDYEIRVFTDNGVGAIGPNPGDNLTDLTNPKRLGFIRSDTAADADQLPLKAWCPNFNASDGMDPDVGPKLAAIGARTTYLWKGYDLNDDGDADDILGKSRYIGDPEETNLVFDEDNLGTGKPELDLNGDGDTDDVIAVNFVSPAVPPVGSIEVDNLGESASFAYVRELDTMADGATGDAPKTRCLLSWNQPNLNSDRHTPDGADLAKPFPACFGVDLVGIPDGSYDSNNNGTTPVKTGETCTDGIVFEIIPY